MVQANICTENDTKSFEYLNIRHTLISMFYKFSENNLFDIWGALFGI